MRQVETIEDLRKRLAVWRNAGERIGFVPTMGNLHAGHLTLVHQSRGQTQRTVVSIFVNPLQFGEGEDFDGYPRTLDRDTEQLRRAGADLLFTPATAMVYPADRVRQTRVEVPGLSDILCGASRPGHFVGVATVVCKLLNMVQPDVAVFGEKDFQQLMVIRRMVSDLAMPVAITGVATHRDPDGLALSSRNGYLTSEERRRAPTLYRTLRLAADSISSAGKDFRAVEQDALHRLRMAGFSPDYVSVRSVGDLAVAEQGDKQLVILAAAVLGKARLIDNLRVTL